MYVCGHKTKVFLAGISIHHPELILLDEPSNHLDLSGRQLLYGFIQATKSTLIIVSHDRKLLELLNTVCELCKHGIGYTTRLLWNDNLNFQIISGEGIVLKGENGSGKTTLIKLILGKLEPRAGTIYRDENKTVYVDQDYSLLCDKLKVYEQALQFNSSALQEHEIKIRLDRFLFTS